MQSSASNPVRTLLFSSLYPSSVRPGHGIFVETRLRELLASGQVETRVVAPVPWFFSTNARYGEYARIARTPRREKYHGVEVLHPRYLLLPKVGMSMAPLAMALGALPALRQLQSEGFDFDVIDAHYYYPDGVAATLLGKWLNKPVTITARGTDLNLIPQYTLPRRMMQWAASKASASIGVCSALIDVLRGWGVPESRLHVMRNGVDLQRFRPLDQNSMRRELGVQGMPLMISVGYLVERKGHHIAIEALAHLLPEFPQAHLLIVGEGVERQSLLDLASRLGLASHLTFTGALPNAELLRWYSAADLMILASSREGWANVLLEAMACGTPVVATRIWGTPEVVANDTAGRLVDERDGEWFARAIADLLRAGVNRAAVRAYAEGFSWQSTTDAQLALFRRFQCKAKPAENIAGGPDA
ncbi:glycosyltransferase family 4 protein [Paucibacter sp. B2R-40]|uniref:glycosyltransferase family 4 protein n=1 Tax=Paucibacter sp. B2R-40 TaxID=2893554 RepID=UPI0021E38491|nr:glycosyltransferase family 4 protein [Paucibacter sp. B2R-40]MCV2355493.1 glycosyltransferase family 4 protein [Paucibacter sp. B2R-40]